MRFSYLLLAMALATPAAAQEYRSEDATVLHGIYDCERGVAIPVTYVNTDAGSSFAILQVEGRQVVLSQQPAASGARYVSIDEQVGYRWHSKGDEALLAFLAADHTAEEETLLKACRMRD